MDLNSIHTAIIQIPTAVQGGISELAREPLRRRGSVQMHDSSDSERFFRLLLWMLAGNNGGRWTGYSRGLSHRSDRVSGVMMRRYGVMRLVILYFETAPGFLLRWSGWICMFFPLDEITLRNRILLAERKGRVGFFGSFQGQVCTVWTWTYRVTKLCRSRWNRISIHEGNYVNSHLFG